MRFRPRKDYLDLLSRHQVAVCLPLAQEGFYLPTLEAMALGCVVVTTDCVGNRDYCADEEKCLMAHRTVESLVAATIRALTLPEIDRHGLRTGAYNTAMSHSLGAKPERFHSKLCDIDRLWA